MIECVAINKAVGFGKTYTVRVWWGRTFPETMLGLRDETHRQPIVGYVLKTETMERFWEKYYLAKLKLRAKHGR